MKQLEVSLRKYGKVKFVQCNDAVTTFLRHSEDRITIINGETVNIEVYENGVPLFLGDKSRFLNILKTNVTLTEEKTQLLKMLSKVVVNMRLNSQEEINLYKEANQLITNLTKS